MKMYSSLHGEEPYSFKIELTFLKNAFLAVLPLGA
jgi:hypothetical protein